MNKLFIGLFLVTGLSSCDVSTVNALFSEKDRARSQRHLRVMEMKRYLSLLEQLKEEDVEFEASIEGTFSSAASLLSNLQLTDARREKIRKQGFDLKKLQDTHYQVMTAYQLLNFKIIASEEEVKIAREDLPDDIPECNLNLARRYQDRIESIFELDYY